MDPRSKRKAVVNQLPKKLKSVAKTQIKRMTDSREDKFVGEEIRADGWMNRFIPWLSDSLIRKRFPVVTADGLGIFLR